jgi:hypothetical protein
MLLNHSLTSKNMVSTASAYHLLISEFLNEDRLNRLNISENKNFINAYYKLYLLKGLQSIKLDEQTSGLENFKLEQKTLIEAYQNNELNIHITEALKETSVGISKKYKDLPMAIYGSSGFGRKLISIVHFSKTSNTLSTLLSDDILKAQRDFAIQLAKQPKLIAHLDYLNNEVKINKPIFCSNISF